MGLGATRVSHEPELPWVVLADPEGNEFCVLPPRSDGSDQAE
ncbi:MAG TPA: VOC family protein [Pseudonocardia sp.]|nr:VOC family protein [Pseudonocardia sp.]